jgi:hypothetical protein
VGFQHITDAVKAAEKEKGKNKKVGRMKLKFVLP